MSGNAASLMGDASAKPSRAVFLLVATLCGAVAFLDGFDSTSMAVAGPAIIETLHFARTQLGPIVSSALLGTMVGALTFGNLGDRFGRKRMLLIATLVFGVLTLATAYATSFQGLLLIRFLAGIGLGGATPCFIALVSEYAPPERRARVTSAVWTAFPVGNVVGTFLSVFLLSKFTWRSIFVTGGVLPLIVLVALAIWLPESARFQSRRQGGGALAVGDAAGMPPRASLGMLFTARTALDTVLLWIASLTVFGVTAAVFYFSPALMHAHGIPLKVAAITLGLAGLGSLVGSPAAGILIEKIGAAATMVTTLVLGTVGVAAIGYASSSVRAMGIDLLFLGLLVSGMGLSGMLAIAAISYPAEIRSTGVGGAVSAGRFGQVIMPLVISGMQFAGVAAQHVFLFVAPLLLVSAVAILFLTMRQRQAGSIGVRLAVS